MTADVVDSVLGLGAVVIAFVIMRAGLWIAERGLAHPRMPLEEPVIPHGHPERLVELEPGEEGRFRQMTERIFD